MLSRGSQASTECPFQDQLLGADLLLSGDIGEVRTVHA